MFNLFREAAAIGIAAALSFSAPLMTVATAQDNQLATVRFGSVGGLTDAGIYLAQEFGYFKEVGIKVERQRIPNAPALTAAVTTGQLDVAGISVTPGLFASVKQGFKIRIVGDKQSYRPGFVATQLAVTKGILKGNEEESFKALKGKTIAVSAVASTVTAILDGMLARHGMKRSDVKLTEMSYPNMVPAMASGAVDAAVVLEPFLTQGREMGVATVLGDPLKGSPGKTPIVVPLVYSEEFAANRDLGERFMLAYMRGVRDYNDAFRKGIRKDEVIKILARDSGVDEKIVREAYKGGLDPNQQVDMESLAAFQKFFVQEGQLREEIDVNQLVDPSFANAAVKKLGHYEEAAPQ